jgi:hypothetical protein
VLGPEGQQQRLVIWIDGPEHKDVLVSGRA